MGKVEIAVVSQDRRTQDRPAPGGATEPGPRMLVVDDEPPILFALDEYFRRLGFEVDTARELEEAQALLTCREYRVVIADLQLRKVSGVEGLELLHWAREHSPRTRFILLTAHGSEEVEEEARRCGVDAFLHKPQPLGRIATLVEGLLDGGLPAPRQTAPEA